MKKFLFVVATGALAGALYAQPVASSNPLIAESRQSYDSVKTNLTRMAEKMPEDAYAFKPVPEIRAFGELVAHIADAQLRMCPGPANAPAAAPKPVKADLVAALKASFDRCDAAWAATTDANANESVSMGGRGGRSRLGMLIFNTIHDNEEYGYMAVYLRLKGVVPPSTADRPAMAPAAPQKK
jgi:hypothetical protein